MNDNETAMVSGPMDYRVKDVSWKDVKKGQLHVTDKAIQLVTRKLWLKPVIAWEIEIPRISSVRLDADTNQIIVESRLGDSAMTDRLVLARASDVRQAFEKIAGLFENYRDQREQQRKDKEEAEKKSRDEAEQKKQQAVRAYRALVSSAGGQVWQATQNLYRIIHYVRKEDWENASKSFREARNGLTGLATRVEVADRNWFGGLEKALEAREGEQVVVECSETLGRFVEFIEIAKPKTPDWEWGDINDVITPNWRHLPYLILLCATYNEALLDYDIGNKEAAMAEIDKLDRLARIVNPLFSVDVNGRLREYRKAIETGNGDLLWSSHDQLDRYILEFFNGRQLSNPAESGPAKE